MYIEVKFAKDEDTLLAITDQSSLNDAIDVVKELFSIDDDIDIIKAYQSKVRDIYSYNKQTEELLSFYDIKGKEIGGKKKYLFLVQATSIDEAHQLANEYMQQIEMEVISVSESNITDLA